MIIGRNTRLSNRPIWSYELEDLLQQSSGAQSISIERQACVWLKLEGFNKVKVLSVIHPVCTSFCLASTVTVSINTFLITWVDWRKTNLHPFICRCCDGNKCVSGINMCIFIKPVNSLFLMVTSSQARKATSRDQIEYSSYTEGSVMLLLKNTINKVCIHSFIELQDTFTVLFIVSSTIGTVWCCSYTQNIIWSLLICLKLICFSLWTTLAITHLLLLSGLGIPVCVMKADCY